VANNYIHGGGNYIKSFCKGGVEGLRIENIFDPFILDPRPVSTVRLRCKYSTTSQKCLKKLGRCDGYKHVCKKKSTNKY